MLISENKNKFIIYKNLVFTELTKDIFCNNLNIFNYIIQNPYNIKKTKKILLIDILDNDNKIDLLNINNNKFLILKKINNTSIINFNDFLDKINNSNINIFDFLKNNSLIY
jgi:hypothetical protein